MIQEMRNALWRHGAETHREKGGLQAIWVLGRGQGVAGNDGLQVGMGGWKVVVEVGVEVGLQFQVFGFRNGCKLDMGFRLASEKEINNWKEGKDDTKTI